jgi:hypothetical protein
VRCASSANRVARRRSVHHLRGDAASRRYAWGHERTAQSRHSSGRQAPGAQRAHKAFCGAGFNGHLRALYLASTGSASSETLGCMAAWFVEPVNHKMNVASSRSRSRGLRQVVCAPCGAQRAAQTRCADLVPRAIAQGMPTPPDSMVDDALRAPTEESRAGGECGWEDSGELKQHPDGGGPMGWCVRCLPRPSSAPPVCGCGLAHRKQPHTLAKTIQQRRQVGS